MARNQSADSKRKQLRGAAAPPPSPKEQLAEFAQEIADVPKTQQT